MYVWGKTWIQAKTQAECYDYLFAAAVKMAHLGLDASRPPAPLIANGAAAGAKRGAEAANGDAAAAAVGDGAAAGAKRARVARPPAAVVLDIEGTVAPISFVAETMFGYAKANVRAFLEGGWEGAEVQEDVEAIRQQVTGASVGGLGAEGEERARWGVAVGGWGW